MSKTPRTVFEPGRGYYTREDWDAVMDDAESTDEELAQARPFAEAFPELAEAIRRELGRSPAAPSGRTAGQTGNEP